jgi:agmatinase
MNINDDGMAMTFMDVPGAIDATSAVAAILGIPFECPGLRMRAGSDQGPAAIREQSRLLRPFQPPHADFDPLERLGVVDCGDVEVTSGDPALAYPVITEALENILSVGAVPVTMGGDGSVTLPQLRAAATQYGPLALIHIDAHTDTGPGKVPGELSPSTTFTRAAEEGLLDMARAIHVGARGTQRSAGAFEFARNLGFEVITGDDMFAWGIAETGATLRRRIGEGPTYLCFDMDFFDPSCAPGVCQPESGGPSTREGLVLLHALHGLDFVAVDVNTVSPPQDLGGITAHLAARVILESLALIAAGPSRTQSVDGECFGPPRQGDD